jgi:hypothetical protein
MCIHILCRSAIKSGHVTTVRTANTDVRRRRPPPPDPLGRTMFSTRAMKNPRRSCQPLQIATSKTSHVAYLRELKEQFQRDIDDTVTQILSEGVFTYNHTMYITLNNCLVLAMHAHVVSLLTFWHAIKPV